MQAWVLAALTCLGTLTAHAQPAPLRPLWNHVDAALQEDPALRGLDGLPLLAPREALREWQRMRAGGPLAWEPPPWVDMPAPTLLAELRRASREGWIPLERALLASAVTLGHLDILDALAWDAWMRTLAPGAEEAELMQTLTRLQLRLAGSFAGFLPDACWEGVDRLPALHASARTLARWPLWREPTPGDHVLMEVQRPAHSSPAGRHPVWATLARDMDPWLEARDRPGPDGPPNDLPGCPAAALPGAAGASTLSWSPEDALVRAALDGWPWQQTLRWATPCWRKGDLTCLAWLLEIEDAAGRADLWPAAGVQALRDMLLNAPAPTIARLSTVEHPWALWVQAESARRIDTWSEARALATRAVDRDPFFAPAYLTRTLAWAGEGRHAEGWGDLVFLEHLWGEDPTWTATLQTVRRRLHGQRGDGPAGPPAPSP
jgi:hypothetical protein